MGIAKKYIRVIQKIEIFSAIAVIALLISGFFLVLTFNIPYVGYNAWNFNAYTLIAENYLRFGFLQTKFAPIVSLSINTPEYYLHHPLLLYVIVGVFTAIFGNDFWVGRSVVIISSIFSLLTVYLIGIELKGKQYASIAVLIAALVPATSIFGRMIGHEPVLLLFILLTTYFLLIYIRTNRKKFVYLAVFFVILGTLTDWPMVYFTLFLFPYLFKQKRTKLWITLFSTSVATALLFLLYIYFFLGGISDLLMAFNDRSMGTLLQLPFWILRWMGTIGVRMLVYFNPVIVFISCLYFYSLLKNKHKTSFEYLLIGFLFFGAFHILLYPEGSFGHPYWVLYLLPFFAFSSSALFIKSKLDKQIIPIMLIIIFMLSFLVTVEKWKRKEVLGNVWRYEIMKDVDAHIPSGEPVFINRAGAIDLDLIESRFRRNVAVYEKVNTGAAAYLIYSCMVSCDKNIQPLRSFTNKYAYYHIAKNEGEAYVFFLRKEISFEGIVKNNSISNKKSEERTQNPQQKERFFRSLYTKLMTMLQAPQL